MSTTYKEPQAFEPEESAMNLMFGSLKPASSLPNEKAHNPQTALKHYKYYPHPLPVLPGPSVADEANELELYREAIKSRRSTDQNESDLKKNETVNENQRAQSSKSSNDEVLSAENDAEEPKPQPDKTSESVKGSKISIKKKKFSKLDVEKKKESSKNLINYIFVENNANKLFSTSSQFDKSKKTFNKSPHGEHTTHESDSKKERLFSFAKNLNATTNIPYSHAQKTIREFKIKNVEKISQSVQCSMHTKKEKIYVVPIIVSNFLKILTFLLQEINKDKSMSKTSVSAKKILNDALSILGDMCNQNPTKSLSFDVTYSDSKRTEKALEDLQRYIKNIYGDKKDFMDKAGGLKKIFIELKQKELELALLNDQVQNENNIFSTTITVNESDFKNPEVALQNKKLESQQLLAKVEFSKRELKKQQKTLAELDWEIKCNQDQVNALKKSSGSKSKLEIIGKQTSPYIFENDGCAKNIKDKS